MTENTESGSPTTLIIIMFLCIFVISAIAMRILAYPLENLNYVEINIGAIMIIGGFVLTLIITSALAGEWKTYIILVVSSWIGIISVSADVDAAREDYYAGQTGFWSDMPAEPHISFTIGFILALLVVGLGKIIIND